MLTCSGRLARFVVFGSLVGINFLNAQNTGSISGLITDKRSSAIPNATIKLTDQETGFVRTFKANESGNYTAPAMPAGTYTLEVSAAGFSSSRQTGVVLNLRDAIRIDAQLDVGTVQETIEVTAETVQIKTENATVGEVVNSAQVEALSVNGRNFTSLAALVPGASSTQPSLNTPVGVTSNTSIAFNGLRTSQNVWRMDGQEDYDRGCGGCIAVLPSVEAISEFKVETANAAVDTGFGSAGQMNVSTKSGARAFHGTGWEYVRNDALDAKNFFTNLNGQPKPPLRFNVYGYNISGPFFVPKLYPRDKSKTFFFFNQEWRKLRQSSLFNSATPTLQQRTGNFSDYSKPITDPLTGQPFPGNIIPATRIDPNASILAKPNFIFPLPTNSNGFYTGSFSVPTDLREEIVRVDHNFNDREQLFFRFIEESNDQNFTNNLWSGNTFPTTTTLLKNNPKLYLGQLTSSISPRAVNELSVSWTYQPLDLSLNGNYQRPAGLTIPELFPENRLNRIPNISFSGVYTLNYDLASWPWSNAAEIFIVRDNVTLMRGPHTIVFGGLYMNFHKQQDLFGQTNGNFAFNGSVTGHAFADFLLGKAFQYTELQDQYAPNYITHSGNLYVSDNWKISPRLTLTAGLSWDGFPHAFEEKDRVASFYLNLYNPANAPKIDSKGLIIPGSGNIYNGLGSAGKNGIPRGLVDNHWALFQPRIGIAWRPIGDNTVIRAGYGLYYERIQGNDIYNVAPNPPFVSTATIFNTDLSNPGGGGAAIPVSNLTVYDPSYPVPQVQQYNAGIQRRLARGMVANVGYVGTKGTFLSDTRNINQPYPAQAAQVLAGTLNVNQARPYPGYGNINMYFNGTNSNYNSLQASLRTEQYYGLTLQASYTYSHSLDYASGDVPGNAHQDAYRWYLERASSNFDRRQIMVFSYIYDIPYKGHGVAGQVFGNWQVSGISAFETGTPLNITLPGDNAGIGTAPYRPDVVKTPTVIGSRTTWFDPAAFAKPAAGNFGNAARNIVPAAGICNTDASLFKNFKFKGERTGLQFRAEFYNIFNHAQWSSFRTNYGAADFGAAIAARDARDIQLGLRLFF
jgi:Carboxypeptidase regulatory-like domain